MHPLLSLLIVCEASKCYRETFKCFLKTVLVKQLHMIAGYILRIIRYWSCSTCTCSQVSVGDLFVVHCQHFLFITQTGGEAQFPLPYMKSEDEDLHRLRVPQPIQRNEKPLDIYAVSFYMPCLGCSMSSLNLVDCSQFL